MAVPKRKTSPSRRGMRQSHQALKTNSAITEDKTTGEQKRSHHVSPDGMYRGRKVTSAKVKR